MRFYLICIAILTLGFLSGCNRYGNTDFADTRPTDFERSNAAEQAMYNDQPGMSDPQSMSQGGGTEEVPFSATRKEGILGGVNEPNIGSL